MDLLDSVLSQIDTELEIRSLEEARQTECSALQSAQEKARDLDELHQKTEIETLESEEELREFEQYLKTQVLKTKQMRGKIEESKKNLDALLEELQRVRKGREVVAIGEEMVKCEKKIEALEGGIKESEENEKSWAEAIEKCKASKMFLKKKAMETKKIRDEIGMACVEMTNKMKRVLDQLEIWKQLQTVKTNLRNLSI